MELVIEIPDIYVLTEDKLNLTIKLKNNRVDEVIYSSMGGIWEERWGFELVKCKNCLYFSKAGKNLGNCPYLEKMVLNDFYCGQFERKEENNER